MIRIIINNNKEVDIKTTKGLEETELATNAAVEIMRNMGRPESQTTCS